MKLKGKKVFVTGADGFIGSHLTEELVKLGYDVRALVFYNSFNSWGWLDELPRKVKQSIEVISGDIRSPEFMQRTMKGCDIVFHLAALISIPFSYIAPSAFVETNITGTLNVLEAAKQLNLRKVIITSTSEVYGTAKFVPITEDHPLQTQSPYAASKASADQLALSFFDSFETPVAILRPFNTYGPRQSARAVIPTAITQIVSSMRKIQLGSLHPTRDFSYVQDTVNAFIAVAESERSIGEVINAGSNFEISIDDTVRLIAEILNVKVEIVSDQKRLRPEKSEVERLWADNTKLKNLTDWKPQYAGKDGFKKGLIKTIRWFREPEHLSRYKTELFNI